MQYLNNMNIIMNEFTAQSLAAAVVCPQKEKYYVYLKM